MHIGARQGFPNVYTFEVKHRRGDNKHTQQARCYSADDCRILWKLYDAAKILLECTHATRHDARHCAAWKGHAKIVKLLLEHNAPRGVEDKKGKAPVDLAKGNGHDEIARMLSGEVEGDN